MAVRQEAMITAVRRVEKGLVTEKKEIKNLWNKRPVSAI